MLFKGARLVDPKNKINKITDIAIRSGKIAKVKEEILELTKEFPVYPGLTIFK